MQSVYAHVHVAISMLSTHLYDVSSGLYTLRLAHILAKEKCL